IELASFITAVYTRGLNVDETVSLTNALVESGDTLGLKRKPIVDKHCSGGVAGNRTTMVMVPVIAAAGLYMPKTSSRSITSASGTADTMEVLAPVEFPVEEMRRIVEKTHGCVVWGGAINLAAADDKLIAIRRPLHLDPRGILLASILAKKKSVGAQYVVIDLPVGRGAKHEDVNNAKNLAREFLEIGGKLGMKVDCFLTDGTDPIGFGIGPSLEAIDVLKVLQNKGPQDLLDKSCQLAGALLEMSGKVPKGRGMAAAADIIRSGKAYKKMLEIIEEQGGNPRVKIDDLNVGTYRHVVKAEQTGRISHVDNRAISRIARAAGAPKDKGAGIILYCEQGDKVNAGDKLFEIVSESESKLSFAIKAMDAWEGVELQKVILGKVSTEGGYDHFRKNEWKFK
ncbi:MAG: thymidine phosphorylase, partial [Candidatus Micrarchaeota archaeon]